MRIGFGYDSHRFVSGRPLILGGVNLVFDRGLEGWSDADVLTHAIMDALCGASALDDIGVLFPPGDERYRNASSLDLLRTVVQFVECKGIRIVNVDCVVIAEQPVLAPYVGEMRSTLAEVLRVDPASLSIKPKTAEGMDAVGRGEGIVAYAVVLMDS
ncbi:MAG: 2-C-methyl-D-erythritol 2,4-cyclodiphosphate synthase [Chloroflexota bacterium]